MERAFLGITLLDKKPNNWIRTKTDIHGIKDTVKDNLHRWAGYLARFTDNRLTLKVTHWYSRGNKRRARPKTRWVDSLEKYYRVNWMAVANDRKQWKMSKEGFSNRSEATSVISSNNNNSIIIIIIIAKESRF